MPLFACIVSFMFGWIADLEKENAELKEIIKGLITPLTEEELHLTITHQQVAYMKAKKILEEEIK